MSGARLAYADPPYPGKAHLYPEQREVDHRELIARLERDYDGWALSTDERALAYVLSLCPPGVRVLAWCRSTAPPFNPQPYAAWEPVICSPARVTQVRTTRSYHLSAADTGRHKRHALTGTKPSSFCTWVIECLGAEQTDTLDDLFPGTGIMGDTFTAWCSQLQLPLLEGAKSVQLAEACHQSNRERRWIDLPELTL